MTDAARSVRLAVIGGGVTGLAAAYEALRCAPGLSLELHEAGPRLGGNIETVTEGGFLLDGGPDSFLRTKPDAVELVRALGLGSQLIAPSSHKVYMVHRGRLEPMPAGMALAVPTALGPMVRTPLLGLGGKLRVLGDLLLPARAGRPADAEDESIGAFVRRRFGRQLSERIAAPLLGGIYAGDVDELSIGATFPQLLEAEARHGSLIRGLAAVQRERKRAARAAGHVAPRGAAPPSPFATLRDGLGGLVAALVAALPAGAARVGSRVVGVAAGARGWELRLADGAVRQADAVILACPAPIAAALMGADALADELASIRFESTATVFFGLRREDVRHPLDAVGFVAPKGGRLMAGTFVSSKWAGRAPEGHVLLRAFLGGRGHTPWIEQSTDAELEREAWEGLVALLGPLGAPVLSRVFRYHRASPQPVVGHLARVARIEQALAARPGLAIAGNGYQGVGLPDCIRQGRSAARRALGAPEPGARPEGTV